MNARSFIPLLALVLGGCSSPTETDITAPTGFGNAVMKPDTRLRGSVRTVNEQGQYVIVDFGLGMIPALQTEMNVYRGGDVVGVVQLTGPIRRSTVAGDIVSGEAGVGDVVIVDPPEEPDADPESGPDQ